MSSKKLQLHDVSLELNLDTLGLKIKNKRNRIPTTQEYISTTYKDKIVFKQSSNITYMRYHSIL